MSINDMVCPYGWISCIRCRNQSICSARKYVPEVETDVDALIKAAAIAEVSTQAEAVEGAKRLKGESGDFWEEWGKYSTPDLHSKEPMPAGQGAPGGGGSSGKVKKDNKGNKKPVYMWGSTD